MRLKTLAALLLAAASLLPSQLHAQAPLEGFHPGQGASEPVHALALQADGKILIGGQFTVVDGRPRVGVARLNADGSLDESFVADTNATVFSLHVQGDGKILVGGGFTEIAGEPRSSLARLNPDGSLDAGFNAQIELGSIFSIVELPDGKLLIGGFFSRVGGQTRNCIARLEADGSLDTSFNPGWGADSYVFTLGVQPDGKILMGGNFQWVDGQSRRHLARLHPMGAMDTGFDLGTDGPVRSLVVEPDGNVLIGGRFTTVGQAWRVGIARFNPFGQVSGNPTSLPGAPDVYSIARDAAGRIVLAGDFPYYNGTARSRIARLEADGSFDSTVFDPGADGLVRVVKVQGDGKIVLGGGFTTVAGQASRNVARIQSDGTSDNGASFDPQADGPVYGMAVQPDGKILIHGPFATVAGSPRKLLARLLPDGKLDAGFDPQVSWPHSNAAVDAVVPQGDGKILIGGIFNRVGSTYRSHLARLFADGTVDSTFNPGPNLSVFALAVQPDGKIVVGGEFTSIAGQPRNRIARLNADGSLDSAFNPNSNWTVRSLIVQPDGKILAGGTFSFMGGQRREGLARLNADGSLDMTYDPRLTSYVTAMVLQPDWKLLVAGPFGSVGGTWHPYFARLNYDGTLDPSFDAHIDASTGFVPSSLALQADGKVLATDTYGVRLQRYNADGSLDAGFTPKFTGKWLGAVALQADGRVLVGGKFTAVEGVPRLNLARLTNNGTLVESLTVNPQGTLILWQRSGTGPEAERVTFEVSRDGTNFDLLGAGVKVPGGWRLRGIALAPGTNLLIRARAWYSGGLQNSSGSIAETVRWVNVSGF